MTHLLLRGGMVVDGTGREPYRADVLLKGDRIAEIGAPGLPPGTPGVDCTGMVVAPGFIDAHSHSDLQAVEGRREKIVQGVTSEVVGNCGFSAFPAPDERAPLHEFANGILCGHGDWGWATAGGYLREARHHAAVNVDSLVGHGSLRVALAGFAHGPLPEAVMSRMEGTLRECLEDGACGFSTGLMYHPGSSAPAGELERLCRVVARAGKIYTTHMRNYSEALPESVEEQLGLARRTGCRLQISHLQAVGAKNWHLQQRALDLIEEAAAKGIDVAFDCYPYVAGSTVLTQWLPQWALAGGTDAMLARFADAAERRRVIEAMLAMLAHQWSDLIVSAIGSPANQPLVGRSIEQIAQARLRDPADVVLDLLTEERGGVNILEFNQSEANLRQTLTHPLSMIISDGFYVHGRPHPRLYGAFPKWIGELCRTRQWSTLAEAVRKVTDYPATRFGLHSRGRLEAGYAADVVVFDPATVDSPATYDDPQQAPAGIRSVYRGGALVC